MKSNSSLYSLETLLYAALFTVALAVRLYALGERPLLDAEAREALTVFHFLRGLPELNLPHSPAYFFFTYFNFLVLQPSEFTARLAPAILGAGFVLTPWAFRVQLGRAPALLTAALFTFSGVLIAASRLADGLMLTLAALGLTLVLAMQFFKTEAAGWLIGAAAALGIAVAGGSAFMMALVLAVMMGAAVFRTQLGQYAGEAWARVQPQQRVFWVALGMSVLVTATVGLMYRSGLGALGASFTNWFVGFVSAENSRSLLIVPLVLWVYEPLILIFGVIGAWRAFRSADTLGQGLAAWAIVALIFLFFYAGRTPADAAWLVIALGPLAARAISSLVGEHWVKEDYLLVGALCSVLVMLLGFAFVYQMRFANQLNFIGPLETSGAEALFTSLRELGLTVLAVALCVVVALLFGFGWSRSAAIVGSTLVSVFALFCLSFSAAWGLVQPRASGDVELWALEFSTTDTHRLVRALGDISNFAVGQEREVEMVVQAEPDGAMAWALRDFVKARFVTQLDAFMDSPVVVAPEAQQDPTLGSAYLGQGFTLYQRWRPENLLLHEQLQWLFTRRAPLEASRYVLWVRQDVQQLQTVTGP